MAPRAQPEAAPPPSQPEPAPVAFQAQQVAQQFGSAFISAGRLASQLVKGLVTPPAAQPRRTEKPAAGRVEEGQGEASHAEGEHGAGEAQEQNPLMAAFSALKRTRLFRFRKTRKLRGGRAHVTSSIVLGDDYNELERDHQHARSYLGEDQEETSYNQAKREAQFLQHLERQGEPPSGIARYLNSQLWVGQDREFKHLLSDQVRPQMEALADQVPAVSPEERRMLAALVSRASYQVGVRSAATFTKLLASAGAAEAAQLSASSEPAPVRAAQLEQALRRAASPAYRAALIEASRGSLERLAGEAARLAPEERLRTWVSLLRAAGSLELESLPSLAEAVVRGLLGTRGADATGALAETLGPALRLAPGGGGGAVHLVTTLAARGEGKAAEKLAHVLREELLQARTRCVPLLKDLRTLRANPTGIDPRTLRPRPTGAAGEATLLQALAEPAALHLSLIPTSSQVLEQEQALASTSAPLIAEAVFSMATLNILAATAPGQHLLRQALLAQERGSQNFLNTLPRVALTLGQASLSRPLGDNGLTAAHYLPAGRPFLEQTALHTGQALAGPVVARSQKGDDSSAKVLLRSAVRGNAALFGLTADGARLAADALEALRDRPGPEALRRAQLRLAKIRKQHSLEKKLSGVEPLLALATALSARESGLARQASERTRAPLGLTALEVAVDQSAHAKKQPAPREPPARTPEPVPGGASRRGK